MQKLFSLSKTKNRGTRPRFFGICKANSISCALPRGGSKPLKLSYRIEKSLPFANREGFLYLFVCFCGLGAGGLMAAQLGFDQLTREARQVVDAVAAGIAVNGLHDGPGERVRVAAQVFDERTLALAEVAVYNALHAGKPLDVGEEQLLLRGAFAAVVEQQGQDALAVERTLSAGRGRLRRDGEPFLRQTAAVQAVTRLEHRVAVFDLVLEGIAAERQVGRALCGAVFVLEAAVFTADVVRAVHERQPAEYTVVPVYLVLPELDMNRPVPAFP